MAENILGFGLGKQVHFWGMSRLHRNILFRESDNKGYCKRPQSRASQIAQAGIIAAVYASATLLCGVLFQGLAWGPVQLRVSEICMVLALFTPSAVGGLTLGCAIANLVIALTSGFGALGLLDVVFVSLATFLGAFFCYKFRKNVKLALVGPVAANALIVPLYLPIMLQGVGFYTIPFTGISLDDAYIAMYLFGMIALAISQTIVVYAIGLPFSHLLKRVFK